ncbi:MAG: pilus assembly protein CpaF [Rhodospirillaceae bacterium]|nr:pilus assembly protein CpaF [Rhodospirillaceae bacterium]
MAGIDPVSSAAGAQRRFGSDNDLTEITERIWPAVAHAFAGQGLDTLSRSAIGTRVGLVIAEQLNDAEMQLTLLQRRKMIDTLIARLESDQTAAPPVDLLEPRSNALQFLTEAQAGKRPEPVTSTRRRIDEAMLAVQPMIVQRIDVTAAARLPRDELGRQLTGVVSEVLAERKLRLNGPEQQELVRLLLDDMLGLGPLEPLLADDTINDIMVNGPRKVFVERRGKIEQTSVTFRDNQHLMNIATRIVSQVGRRIDESSPLCDARLADGSRVNIIVPPLALDGPTISIRKFAKKKITLDSMVPIGSISAPLANVIKIAARCRLNIVISGGTGSGKTTLLNAMSQLIDPSERIVSIEDAAELQLQQPHVVRLESRPPNLEGGGEITIRDLLRNALRMRPDRILIGEVRGHEAIDLLQAMNTGHDGSLGTIHSNNPREALTRLENMIGMAGINLSPRAVRTQISAAVDMIIQVTRMRDGVRRVTSVAEVVGMEGDVITMQDLFTYEFEGEDAQGRLIGRFKSSGLRPHFTPKAAYFGVDRLLLESMSS